ncbi:uncharacterized protein LOC111006130 [Momordica charantia]|uniref:Uncharacterized protein LOC111006130 n=1 Tax=Momordica charantia TaxID=3673 RepID=A0A6J1BVJ4_MOMCH|nr:uncharacterized protein LOC111006130 [Momordica charantia]
MSKPYTCYGCKEVGFGPHYQCENYYFDLHKECKFPETWPISHQFFPNSTFNFFRIPPKACHDDCRRLCDACRKPINGFVYHCQNQDLDLHPCCRNLNKNYKIKDVEFNLHKEVRGKCLWCNRKSINGGTHNDNGWSYISECGKYHVHVACIAQMALEESHKSQEDCAIDDVTAQNQEQALALLLKRVNLESVQARGRGDGRTGTKFWRILKGFVRR